MNPLENIELSHRQIDLGDVTLHTVVAGEGPLVILLHGFPEFWYSWRYQIPALVNAGYRVAVPDLRGYNQSTKPVGIANYHPKRLIADVRHLGEALGERRFHLGGHDWGANIAWMFAMTHPEMLHKLLICNVPHPVVMAKHLWTIRQGLKKSWYIFFFQLPWLPERSIRAQDFRSIRTMLKWDPVNKETVSAEDIERYVEAMKVPGALTASINYYRAIFWLKKAERRELIRPIDLPVQMIWGMKDRYLGPELIETPESLVRDLSVHRIADASHWVQCDAHAEVNNVMLDFLAR